MFDSQDRRSALARLVAGVGVAGFALGEAIGGAAADAETEKKKHKKAKGPERTWSGRLIDPVYTPIGVGDTVHYHITAQGGGDGTMDDMKRDRKVAMTDARLFRYMEKKSGGNYKGEQCLRLQGMNWRLLGADYNAGTNTWTLDVKVCESNPNARPNAQGAGGVDGQGVGDEVSGCSCSCGDKCYQCGLANNDAKRCGDSFQHACPNETW